MLQKEEVLKIAKLSKLRLNEEELEKMQIDLNKIFAHIEELNELDVEGIEPLYNVNNIVDVTRNDDVKNTVKKQDFLNNAPNKDSDFIILPRIVSED